MKSITSTFFEVTVRIHKTLDDGTEKTVPELFTVQAETFTEAEANITEELAGTTGMEVRKEVIAPYREVFYSDDSEKYYKCKVHFITIDEKSGKEKKQSVIYLVAANSTEEAQKNLDSVMSKGLGDYKIASLSETSISDIVWRN